MQLGLIGLGRMGGNMARRWLGDRHECVGYAHDPAQAEALRGDGIVPAASLAELVSLLQPPRAIWIMIPAAAVDGVIEELDAAARCRRHVDRRRQLALRRRRAPCGGAWRTRAALPRRRRQRRHLGSRAGLLPHDRRRRGRFDAARPVVRVARARRLGRHTAERRYGAARLSALRSERRRPFREDGAQRYRIRPHGRLRRRIQLAAARQYRPARDTRRCGNCAAHRARRASRVRLRSRSHSRTMASRQRRAFVAARHHRGRARPRPATR